MKRLTQQECDIITRKILQKMDEYATHCSHTEGVTSLTIKKFQNGEVLGKATVKLNLFAGCNLEQGVE